MAAATGCAAPGTPDIGTGPMRALVASLRVRLVLGFALSLGLALAAVGTFVGLATDRQTELFEAERDLAQAGRVSQFITNNYVEDHGAVERAAGLNSIVEQASAIAGLRITMFDANENVVADSHGPSDSISNPDHVDEPVPFGRAAEKGNDGEVVPLIFEGDSVGSVVASSDLGSFGEGRELALADPNASRISAQVNRYLLWAGVGAAALGTALVWGLSRRTLAPLQSLGETARRLGRGDLSQRAETGGPTEIRQLARSFNAMASELEEAERRRRSLTTDVAHELRAPASNIQGYLEAIEDGVFQPTPETIGIIHGQALLLSRLVEDLRLLAQSDAGELELRRTPTRVAVVMESAVDAVRARAEGKGVNLILKTAPTLPRLKLDASRMAQVVGNLLDNALTHTLEGGTVTASAHASKDCVEVVVADTGPGIAAEDLSRVFDRFYRTDPSRSRNTGGTGLGLTIARRIVEAHGGSLDAKSEPGRGSRFVIRLSA